MKKALSLTKDRKKIQELMLISLVHRRKLLNLGHDLNIRLHYGATLSAVEILTALYMFWMNINPKDPSWNDRDRFILSKGHAAPSLYITLSMLDFFPEDEFQNFRKLNSKLQGHPDRHKTPGVDCSSGSLGQGFPVACGMALGAIIDDASFKVYTLISDGECNEGSTWEAALIASNLKIDKLILLLDWNKKSSYGTMKGRNDIEPLAEKWQAFGWRVFICDGHDFISLTQALAQAESVKDQPSIILCNTIKGKDLPYAEKHHTRSNFALTEEQYQEAITHLDALEKQIKDESS